MRTIVVLTVITLFALSTARCADAGVMLGESPSVIAQDSSSISAQMPLQQEEQKRFGFRKNESSGLSGFTVSLSHSVCQSAAAFENGIPEPNAILLDVLRLANDALPVSPVLCGLLKPS
jgi:hypothetical protein